MRVKIYAGEHYQWTFEDTPRGPRTGSPCMALTDEGHVLLLKEFGNVRVPITMTSMGDEADKREHMIVELRVTGGRAS